MLQIAPTSHKSWAHLPQAEDKESKQEQPSQDAAHEDPQGDGGGGALNHLQEALHIKESLFWFDLPRFAFETDFCGFTCLFVCF